MHFLGAPTPTLDSRGLVELLLTMDGPCEIETRLRAAILLVNLVDGNAPGAPSKAQKLRDEIRRIEADITRIQAETKRVNAQCVAEAARILELLDARSGGSW
jgi:hypothetical protein